MGRDPDGVKDPDGYWYGDYYGVLAFETNTAVVPNPPKDWSDLLKPEYKGQVALSGDPNVSAQAIQTVLASSLANGSSLDDATAGLDFWKQAVQAGNFVPVIATNGTIDHGDTPITIRWNYNSLANRDQAEEESGLVIDVAILASGLRRRLHPGHQRVRAPSQRRPAVGGVPVPDEGQNAWLTGYCYPARFDAMKAAGTLDADALAKLPDATGAVFATIDQQKLPPRRSSPTRSRAGTRSSARLRPGERRPLTLVAHAGPVP
ncbi:MAG: extracellular solute-binding protein [Chloroflexota bacterium]